MRTARRRRVWLGSFAAMALAITVACTTVACTPGEDGNPNAGPPGEAGALAHAECMREHGFEWPDPKYVDGEWETHYEGIDLESSAFREAEVECRKVQERADADSGSVDDPEERARMEQEMEQHLRFAACMRDQGIDFPDPVMDDDGNISGPAGPLDGDQEAFDAARQTCEEKLGEPMP